VAAEVVLAQEAEKWETVDRIFVLASFDKKQVPAVECPDGMTEEHGQGDGAPLFRDERDGLQRRVEAFEHVIRRLVIETGFGWRSRRGVSEDVRQELWRERRDCGWGPRIHD